MLDYYLVNYLVTFYLPLRERFNEISQLPDEDKKCIYSLLDAYLAKNKLKAILQ